MKLDEEKIIETAQKIKKGLLPKETLKELLGSQRLDDIFDSQTQQAIFDSIINNGKLHHMLPNGNGFDILNGLLNNQVSSNLSDFYMIKPDYIFQLSPEQQKNMANSIAGGRQDLSLALQTIWNKKIRTEACTTKNSDNNPMLQLNIKENEFEKQNIIQQLYEQIDISGQAFYDTNKKEFIITLSGNNLYNYLQKHDIPLSKIDKENIFERALRDSLEFLEEIYTSYSQNGIDTSELRKEILSIKKSLEIINRRIENNQEQTQIIKRKSWELSPEERNRIQIQTTKLVHNNTVQEKQEEQERN